MYFLPRRTIACEKIFQEESVYGDIVVGEYPLGFIPFDSDLLSLELGTAYRVRHNQLHASSFHAVRQIAQCSALEFKGRFVAHTEADTTAAVHMCGNGI